jgi:hypothetical protein
MILAGGKKRSRLTKSPELPKSPKLTNADLEIFKGKGQSGAR